MIDAQKLRQRILDLAICGKLVLQDPNDEPASILLERRGEVLIMGPARSPNQKNIWFGSDFKYARTNLNLYMEMVRQKKMG